MTSGLDSAEWSVTTLESTKTLSTASAVILFTCNGLQSLFFAFITIPCLSAACFRIKKVTFGRAIPPTCICTCTEITSTPLIAVTITYLMVDLSYWILQGWRFCSEDSIANLLYSDRLFSPYPIHNLFYGLTAIMAFICGSALVPPSRDSTPSKGSRLFHRLGYPCIFVMLAISQYHTIFVVLAMISDPLAMLSNLVILVTSCVFLLSAAISVRQQYQKSKLNGFLALVLTLQMIIILLYYGLLLTVYPLTTDVRVASTHWLGIVTVLSIFTVSFSCSITYRVTDSRPQNTTTSMESGDDECKQIVPFSQQKQQFLMALPMPAAVKVWEEV